MEKILDLQLHEHGRLKDLLNTKELEKNSPFRQSVFIEMMIRLNSLLQFLSSKNKRITFTDDVKLTDRVGDITDLVSKIRNAAVHDVTSGENRINDNSLFVFNIVAGYSPNAFKFDGLVLGCDYDDDIAYYYGQHRIYLKRHIHRLANEVEKTLVY